MIGKIYNDDVSQRKVRVAILMTDNVDSRSKNITHDTERDFPMMKGYMPRESIRP